ncbi:hypothetical protein IPA_06155 [Ignicoccus pacificus DSM 13166]|uniref:Uncharacterized protein n=1 Tax=Ignicoccus pacificus DSM 13166 TaxID=940294 RepID=A0A977KBH7_9CREN|nr:hypothetical protein IPA_06155 [Ignicoccus pacificus DSM 13166]
MRPLKKGQLEIIGIVIALIILGFILEAIYLYLFEPKAFEQIFGGILSKI